MRVTRLILALLASSALFVSVTGVALADANPKASCVGIGSSEVAPGGRDDIALEGRDFFFSDGVPPGENTSLFAKLHEGSLEDCLSTAKHD